MAKNPHVINSNVNLQHSGSTLKSTAPGATNSSIFGALQVGSNGGSSGDPSGSTQTLSGTQAFAQNQHIANSAPTAQSIFGANRKLG